MNESNKMGMLDLSKVYMVYDEKPLNKEFVLKFLEDHYFTREPMLTKYAQIHAQAITPQLREAILGDLRRRYDPIVQNCCISLVGLHAETNLPSGIGLAMLERRQDQGNVPEWDRVPFTSELMAVWCRYVLRVAERWKNFFEVFPDVNTIMKIVMVGVEQEHERRRLGANILRELVDRASMFGAELVYGLFTSDHLKRVAYRLGFRSFADISLYDFRDHQGNVMYQGAQNQIVSLMAIRVAKSRKAP